MQGFDFAPADMEANRRGSMMKEQRIKFRQADIQSLRGHRSSHISGIGNGKAWQLP
jgi:hypothetical protein